MKLNRIVGERINRFFDKCYLMLIDDNVILILFRFGV